MFFDLREIIGVGNLEAGLKLFFLWIVFGTKQISRFLLDFLKFQNKWDKFLKFFFIANQFLINFLMLVLSTGMVVTEQII